MHVWTGGGWMGGARMDGWMDGDVHTEEKDGGQKIKTRHIWKDKEDNEG